MKKERIETVVARLGESIAEKLGYELIDVEYRKEGSNWILRCFIDCPSGVGIDQCQTFSEALEKVLDTEDPIPGSYLLEVSSPGLERPLKKESDFMRYLGQQVEIKLHKAIAGKKQVRGELVGYKAETKLIEVKINNSLMEIPFEEVAKANLVVDCFGAGGGK